MIDSELQADELTRIVKTFELVPYVRLLGMEFVDAGRGWADYRLLIREELTRMRGIAHGGAITSLMDTAAAFAVHTILRPEEWTVTVDLTIHFLKPTSRGEVVAHARVVRDGRSLVIISVEAKDEERHLVAIATTTYLKRSSDTR
jgi:uncharacterized protein (TIGR00369 family)